EDGRVETAVRGRDERSDRRVPVGGGVLHAAHEVVRQRLDRVAVAGTARGVENGRALPFGERLEQPHGPAGGSPPAQLCGAENRRTRRHVRVVAARSGLEPRLAADPARVKAERRAAEVSDAPPLPARVESRGAQDKEGTTPI